jgi:HD-like signal output (HDOD) protein
MGAESALYTILIEKIKQDALVLPTLPKIALNVRQAADNADISLGKMSDIISHDAAISLGVIKVANSVLFGREIKVESVTQAVTRIGLRKIKSIATAIAIEQMFVSNNPVIAKYMQNSWGKTVDVASVAIALMTLYLKKHKHAPFTLGTLTLAALIHNIGILPILTEAENHPEVFAKPVFLQQAIAKLSNEIGAELTKAWGFSEEFTELVMSWNDLTILSKEVHYLDFIRAGAVHHEIFDSKSRQDILLESLVIKDILPDVKFMESEAFSELLIQVRAILN